MKNSKHLALKLAGLGSLALLLSTSAFADSRPLDQTFRGDDGQAMQRRDGDRDRDYDRDRDRRDDHRWRENDRVRMEGHIREFRHERDGYRLRLDRDDTWYWVPDSYFRGHAPRAGLSVTLGGIFRGGAVVVDAVTWPDAYGYQYRQAPPPIRAELMRGIVERVEYRRGIAWIRNDLNGRLIEVDLRGDRRGRFDAGDLHRGDFVELTGNWVRGGVFFVDQIQDVHRRRY